MLRTVNTLGYTGGKSTILTVIPWLFTVIPVIIPPFLTTLYCPSLGSEPECQKGVKQLKREQKGREETNNNINHF